MFWHFFVNASSVRYKAGTASQILKISGLETMFAHLLATPEGKILGGIFKKKKKTNGGKGVKGGKIAGTPMLKNKSKGIRFCFCRGEWCGEDGRRCGQD